MKKNLQFTKLKSSLVMACLLLLTVQTHAQDTDVVVDQDVMVVEQDMAYTAPFKAGVKIGANVNQFMQTGTAVGGNGGIFVNWTALEWLDAQIEFLFNQQGGGREDYNFPIFGEGGILSGEIPFFDPNTGTSGVSSGSGSSSEIPTAVGSVESIDFLNRTVYLNNIEIPLIARITLPDLSGAIRPRVIIGGAYGININAWEFHDKFFHFVDGTEIIASNQKEKVTGDFERHQFGFVSGFAIDYILNNRLISTEIRYRLGLNELNSINLTVPELMGDLYTHTISFNIQVGLYDLPF